MGLKKTAFVQITMDYEFLDDTYSVLNAMVEDEDESIMENEEVGSLMKFICF